MENHTAINENIILKVFLVNSYNKTPLPPKTKIKLLFNLETNFTTVY